MITIYANGKEYTAVYYVNIALPIIKSLKRQGYRVEWTCNDPEDNEYLWENS